MTQPSQHDLDPAKWGIKETPPRDEAEKRTVGARVPVPIGDEWNGNVSAIADATGLTKGNVAAVGMLIAIQHKDEWVSLARKVSAEGIETQSSGNETSTCPPGGSPTA